MTETQKATVGSVWDIGTTAKNPVMVSRPDSSEVQVLGDGKSAGHVLDLPGTYVAYSGGKSIGTVTAV